VLPWLLTGGPAFGQQWPDERSEGPFHFHADFALEPLASTLRATAELGEAIPDLLELPRGQEMISVYLFHDRATYRDYLAQHFPEVPLRRALYIKPRGPGMVFAHAGAGLEEDLRHEATHAILHTILPEVPLWLDEGLAEYFESTTSDGPREQSRRAWVLRDLDAGEAPRLEELEAKADMGQMRAIDYRQARAWVHFLLHGPAPVRQVFRDYVTDLRTATTAPTLTQRLARRCPDFEVAFRQHLRSSR